MKRFIAAIVFIAIYLVGYSQTSILADGKSFDSKRMKSEKYQMDCYLVNGHEKKLISYFKIDVGVNSNQLSLVTVLSFLGTNETVKDTVIANVNKLTPIFRSSYSKQRNYAISFNKDVTGYYVDKATRKKTEIKEQLNNNVMDSYLYPYILGTLTLNTKFKGNLSVYDYKNDNSNHISNVNITTVENATYASKQLGSRNVWKVNVQEESTTDKYSYYVDKESGKLWKIDIDTKGQNIEMIDNEIKLGNATITGQVFARDNENEGLLGGKAILNINKKQFAQQGTGILLIPDTPEYREFKESLKKYRKDKSPDKIKPTLPEEFIKTIRQAYVKDNKGNYEITDVLEGQYLLLVTFGYIHTSHKKETIGQTDVYVNGTYQGSNPIDRFYTEGQNAAANIEKEIKVEQNQKVIKINLKKTL